MVHYRNPRTPRLSISWSQGKPNTRSNNNDRKKLKSSVKNRVIRLYFSWHCLWRSSTVFFLLKELFSFEPQVFLESLEFQPRNILRIFFRGTFPADMPYFKLELHKIIVQDLVYRLTNILNALMYDSNGLHMLQFMFLYKIIRSEEIIKKSNLGFAARRTGFAAWFAARRRRAPHAAEK